MITYTSGDLLNSTAEALVNTVNCEGYMGKGIAYQFKLKFPDNNADYVRACNSGDLAVGKLHYFLEKGKIIINFPTKNKWRERSKIEYINDGLDELIKLITALNIKTIAIPPLGSGNGGLIWTDVKRIIEDKLSSLADDIQVFIYEPSQNYLIQSTLEPKLGVSALYLIEMKKQLVKFDTKRLQTTALFVNVLSGQKYFSFQKYKDGPRDKSITNISKSIKDFQKYYNINNVEDTYRILYYKLASDNVDKKLNQALPFIKTAAASVNSFTTNHELECTAKTLFIITEQSDISQDEISNKLNNWSEDKITIFSDAEVSRTIDKLFEINLIEKNLMGFRLK